MSSLVSLGLPASGKSTFLAALWHVLESGEIPSALRRRGLQADREYLNRIRDAWAVFEKVPRTETPEGSVVFDLADDAGDLSGQVRFPDLPGESFDTQWTERIWTEEFDQQVREADGFLLFISPNYVSPLLIREATRRIPGGAHLREPDSPPRAERAWDARKAPTQAKLVDLLQFLADARDPGRPSPLALVVSAWDIAERQPAPDGTRAATAEAWVRAHMPLLWQYVTANPEVFRARWYGVSAQGGDLGAPEELSRLQDFELTSERIRVLEDTGEESHDPTRPLRWLLEQARSAS
jgi:hypothetical protein